MIECLAANSCMAFVLLNDSKKKISLFEKATPGDGEREKDKRL